MRLSTQSLQQRLSQDKKANTGKLSLASLTEKIPFIPSLIIAWIAGAVFTFSLAPYGYWVLALLSPAVLYALLLPKMTDKRAFAIGEAYGMGLWCVGAFWLYTSIHTYGDTPMPLALLAIGGMGLLMGLFHALMAVLFNRFVGKQPFAFASLWVLQEWLKTWVLTGFPWLFVGYAFTEQYWLSSLAPVFGVFAITFVAVLLSASFIETLRRRAEFLVVTAGLLLVSVMLWLIDPQWTQAKDNKPLKVAMIQGNIPQDIKWLTEYQNETLEIYAKLSQKEWQTQDMVIWPESSIPMFQTQAWGFITQVAKVAYDNDTTWVTGIPFKDELAYKPETDPYPPFYNSVVALGAKGEGLYKKQRLVPFGEYIPLEGMLNLFPNLAGSQEIMSYSRGSNKQQPLKVQDNNMGVAVCYEVAYPETTRHNAKNTDFLLTISNDAWFGTSAGPLQHLQMVQMRSLETGRWFLRATNTGVTAIINEKGQIIQQVPQFERTVLRGEVQSRIGETPFMKLGELPMLIVSVILIILSVLGQRAKILAIYGKDSENSPEMQELSKVLVMSNRIKRDDVEKKDEKPVT